MKNLILLLLSVICLTACSSYKDAMKADTNMRKIELGMAKNEVIKVMGNSYQRMGASTSTEGVNIETLGYPTVDAIYMLYFENDKLIEFHKDMLIRTDRVIRESSSGIE
ncbi:MAG: hypothetical protein E6772_08820 [Dysgonomonas sp.]|nr:hypothetical protein [Dysgonomonas sp.]